MFVYLFPYYLFLTRLLLFLFYNYNTEGSNNNIYIPSHAGFTFWYNRNFNITTNHGIENNLLNIRGLRDNAKRRSTLNWFRGKKKKIVSVHLREIHCTENANHQWTVKWGNQAFLSSNSGRFHYLSHKSVWKTSTNHICRHYFRWRSNQYPCKIRQVTGPH